MKEFHELLNPHVLTDSYKGRRTNGGKFPLTETYYANPRDVEDDEFDMVYFPEAREPAPGNVSGGEARILTPGAGTKRKAAVFPQYNKIKLPGDAIFALREPNSLALQKKGATSVAQVFDDFGMRHKIYKELVLAKTLADGVVYANNVGQILESSSGAAVTADFGVAATHKTDLDGIIDVLWSDPTADIPAHITAIFDAAEAAGVEKPTDIWLHANKKTDLRNNEQFQFWAQNNDRVTDVVLRGEIIEGLWGLTWHFYGGKYKAVDGTMKDFIPQTKAFLCPSASSPWVDAVQGKTLVPTDLNIVTDWRQALAKAEEMYGPYSYAKLTDDPMALWLYMGDKFGIYFPEPNAIWQPTLFA